MPRILATLLLLAAGLLCHPVRAAEPAGPSRASDDGALGLDSEQKAPAGITAPLASPHEQLRRELVDLLERRRAELDRLRTERAETETIEEHDELGARIREQKLLFHIQLLELSARAANSGQQAISEEQITEGLEVLRERLKEFRARHDDPRNPDREGER